jgi:hypothetical protein
MGYLLASLRQGALIQSTADVTLAQRSSQLLIAEPDCEAMDEWCGLIA